MLKYTRSDRHLALVVVASGSIYELCVPPQSQASNNAHVTMAVCRSATTSTQRQDCHTSMNTKSRSKKLRIFSVSHCKIYADAMILEFQWARLGRGGISK